MPKKQSDAGSKLLVQNKKARFEYHIIEKFEAGIVLTGSEIKSIRAGKVSLAESWISPYGGELYLVGAHINPYEFSSDSEYDPVRKRKLLLHRHEINELTGKVEKKGLTIVPLEFRLKRGYAKLEIALAKGKDAPDKRRDMKDKETRRDAARAMKMKK